MKRSASICLALALGWTSGAHAASAPDPAAIATRSANTFAVPHFRAVSKAAGVQALAWERFCGKRDAAGLARLKAAFTVTADAWAQVDFVRMGPATKLMRTERFNYWLDRGNAAGRSLTAMVAAPDAAGLAPEAMTGSSAAAQGLPVLERLLFDEAAGGKLLAATPEGERRCAVGRAVARNLAGIANDLTAEWSGADGVAAAIAADKPWGVYFASSKEAASVLLTDLVIGLEGLKDNETALVFHDEANPVSIRLAPAWRSARSLAVIRAKYGALKEALQPFLADADAKTSADISAAFTGVDTSLKAMDASFAGQPAHSPERRAALQATLTAMGALVETVMTAAPKASGIALGFNSLDGD